MASHGTPRLLDLTSRDPLERAQASLVQTLLLAVLILSAAGSLLPLAAPIPRAQALGVGAVVLLGVPIALAALALLRRGRLARAVLLASVGLIVLLCFVLVTTGVRDGGATIFGFALPIVLSGLLAGRRSLVVVIGLCAAGIGLAMALERLGLPLVGFAAPRGDNPGGIVGGFIVIALILGVFVAHFGRTLREALLAGQRREQGLEQRRGELEAAVAAGTEELRAALAEVEARAASQAALLEENARQREAIQELGAPALPVNATTVVMPLVGALDDRRLRALQDRALEAAERGAVRRLVLDISGVPLVDTQVAQGLASIVRALRLLGAEAALVGVRPEVAQALVGLGIELDGVRTYRDLEAALRGM